MTDYSRSSRFYSSSSYDRYHERPDTSTLGKMQQQFWVTKQAVMRKLGRKEDEHIVASDAELDAKLELFTSIEDTSLRLQKVIEMYQDRILALSQEENCMGRFLKEQGKVDKTRAGKMMAAAGKSLSFTAQQRLSLRVPLVRLHQEVETFRCRAIADTLINVNSMENSRTEYRGALMWMKDVSQELDPDTYKQLDKFRRVQNQVRQKKARFDKLKVDCLQKVDLLAASRCNMFSHALANYQNTLLSFWKKTSRTMSSVAESFKGYQHYEFSMLKELTESSKKLAEETSGSTRLDDGEEELDKDKLIFFDEFHDDDDETASDRKEESLGKMNKSDSSASASGAKKSAKTMRILSTGTPEELPLLDLSSSGENHQDSMKPNDEIKESEKPLLDKQKNSCNHGLEELDISNKDDLALLEEILNMPSGDGGGSFDADWTATFGEQLKPSSEEQKSFMPSQLLEMDLGLDELSLQETIGSTMIPSITPSQSETVTQGAIGANTSGKSLPAVPKPSNKGKSKDMSTWFNLFADLDPLSNPDAVGRSAGDASEEDRNC